MKRNYLPDSSEQAHHNEQEIITQRLDELFSHSVRNQRQVPISNKGYWIHSKQHVRVDSIVGLPNELINFSPEFPYHFLNPFQALYCLEASQLLIYLFGFPLSISEAYELLLKDEEQFRYYRVFQQLNRTGYVCLKPIHSHLASNMLIADSDQKLKQEDTQALSDSDTLNCESETSIQPLFKINTIYKPYREILDNLKQLGPKDAAEIESTLSALSTQDGGRKNASTTIAFDIYKRENFAKNKPRKDKQGNPDYKLIVCDKSRDKPPSCQQLLAHRSALLIEGGEQASKYADTFFDKLLFAVVDGDASICFTQFKPSQFLLNDANFIYTK